ncbi:MAG: hypothetical protein VX278_05400 [Myxococcota bacterium]|nr:hypothetical protein [Myxococcota bacterium]
MSDVLRAHIQDFGFKHAEISRRASKLNQATTYRVVEGETQNPSLNSITGIIEAISLTDADAGVLYRKMGSTKAKPRLFVLPKGIHDYDTAKIKAQNYLDSGRIRDAAHNVMAMFDLAETDEQLCETYEQAGIVYMGLGRWEEAQVNFEAADAHLDYNIDDPKTPDSIIDRKHSLMTNIGSLMVKRGNLSWALLFGRAVANHPRVNEQNKGWGYLVLGEAALGLRNPEDAKKAFRAALNIFETNLQTAETDKEMGDIQRNRQTEQAEGNIRWARIHLLKSQLLLGEHDAGEKLQQFEALWFDIDPEASTMAGLFYAENLKASKRKKLLLRDLRARAQRYSLGEIVQRIALVMGVFMLTVLGGFTKDEERETVQTSPIEYPKEKAEKRRPWDAPSRGNTGG